MKNLLFTSAALAALAMASTAHANQCVQMGDEGNSAVNHAYDAEIQKYRTLQNAGAVTVEIDIDGEGPEPTAVYNVTAVIAAYEKAKTDGLKQVEQGVTECNVALKEAKADAKVASTAALINPGSAIIGAAVDSALDDLGLGPNNDLRGAIGTMINPTQSVVRVITQPDKVIKKIIHKPLKIFTPWKW